MIVARMEGSFHRCGTLTRWQRLGACPGVAHTTDDTPAAPSPRSGFISYVRYGRRMTEDYKGRIGNLIRDARKHRGLTQHQLAEKLATSQSAINRIEKGQQNLSLDLLARIGAAVDSEI